MLTETLKHKYTLNIPMQEHRTSRIYKEILVRRNNRHLPETVWKKGTIIQRCIRSPIWRLCINITKITCEIKSVLSRTSKTKFIINLESEQRKTTVHCHSNFFCVVSDPLHHVNEKLNVYGKINHFMRPDCIYVLKLKVGIT